MHYDLDVDCRLDTLHVVGGDYPCQQVIYHIGQQERRSCNSWKHLRQYIKIISFEENHGNICCCLSTITCVRLHTCSVELLPKVIWFTTPPSCSQNCCCVPLLDGY